MKYRVGGTQGLPWAPGIADIQGQRSGFAYCAGGS